MISLTLKFKFLVIESKWIMAPAAEEYVKKYVVLLHS